jgi:hypothetical protein
MTTEMVVADAIEAAAWRDMFAAMPPAMAAATGARVVDAGGATLFVAPGIPISYFNRAIGLGNERPAREADVDAILDVHDGAGVRSFLVHTSDATRAAGDLEAWLRARGLGPFAARPTRAKLLRGPEPPPRVSTELTLRAAEPIRASALAVVLAEAHGMPAAMVPWIVALVGRPGWSAYVMEDGEAVVGGGFLWQDRERVWLGMGGTAAAHRRRGGQRALFARRLIDAAATGATVIATETGEPVAGEANPSLANMQWAGFRRVGSRRNWARLLTTKR